MTPSAPPIRSAPPGVLPLELWDLELSSGILWDHMEPHALPHALREAIDRLRRGTARTRSRWPIPELVRSIDAVWLAGGRAASLDPAPLSAAVELPVWRAEHPAWVAERGAEALVPAVHPLAVIDLGQSHLKITLAGHRLEHPRPWDRLPLADAHAIDTISARTTLRRWVGGCLADATARTRQRPRAVVLALPCALDDGLRPGPSSYPGLHHDTRFVPDVVTAAGWSPRVLHVLNDAELAAVAAGLDPRTRGTLTLVLTLGFGVGGALRLP